ncbi:gluconokinase [Alsobacter sp. SYSU M60028]|uniref:Gluconokinase n=1 Tax=Alsobacter ponti TaxID=2962936 RepID=A0ABT1LGJ3_9HYPH|nr:gluconokinase [Alsobacter ponti]MCP8940621.1 gluconokinase [Alsobacter ponti]
MSGADKTAPVSVVVIMGVSSSGKTTTASLLSERLGWPFRDADSFHPPANVEKMSRGVPLTDADRAPWLEAIAAWIRQRIASGEPGIVTCSALKRAYRDVLMAGNDGARLVHLVGDRALIGDRMARRRDHFMPTSLLDSQFATLEPPAPEENVLSVPVSQSPAQVAETIIAALGLRKR